ncbi:MAG: amidohydrolase [Elusimicrobia bacterium]|nr:amidohydrolase [Elusimicrobiota bacterium]
MRARPKIDVHTHILPAELPDLKARYGYGGFLSLARDGSKGRLLRDDGSLFRELDSNCWDLSRRLEDMDRCGVETQVLSTIPVMFSYWAKPEHGLDLARLLNDHIAEIGSRRPERFIGLGTLPLQSPELSVKELERCVKTLGLAGVQIGSNVNGENLDWPGLRPVWEAAEALGAAVFVHPWDMLAPERMRKYWFPWLIGMPTELALAMASLVFSGTLERLPRLRLAFAHGGGAFCALIGRMEQGFKARPDLCASDTRQSPASFLGRFYVDSLVHDPRQLVQILDVFGRDKVLLGSDYPFPLGESAPGRLIESLTGIGEAEKAALLHDNALRWLGRTREKARAL